MTKELEQLTALVLTTLKRKCIYLTGNTLANIKKVRIVGNRVEIEIAPPNYDIGEYIRRQVIVPLGDGKSYANQTNEKGTIFRPSKTKYWVNTDCVKACQIFANQIGAIVKNKLPINPKW